MNFIKLVSLGLIVFSLCSCASVQQSRCKTDYAYQIGYNDAQSGRPRRSSLHVGNVCDKKEIPYGTQEFERDYLAGYQNGLSVYCNEAKARSFGTEDGDKFSRNRASELSVICAETNRKDWINAYNNGHSEALQRNCTSANFYQKGVADARANTSGGSSVVGACPTSIQSELSNAYNNGYRETKAMMLGEQVLTSAIGMMNGSKKETTTPASNETEFTFEGKKLVAWCEITDETFRRAKVTVRNKSDQHVRIYGKWSISLYDEKDINFADTDSRESLSIWRKDSATFTTFSVDEKARRCRATYEGR